MIRHRLEVLVGALAIATALLASACAITADDHPHPITRESTTSTIATGP